MSRHDDTVRLRHMLDHAREATQLVAGRTRGALDQDRVLNLALTRLLEVVGEAAARVSGRRKRDEAIPKPGARASRPLGRDLWGFWDSVISPHSVA